MNGMYEGFYHNEHEERMRLETLLAQMTEQRDELECKLGSLTEEHEGLESSLRHEYEEKRMFEQEADELREEVNELKSENEDLRFAVNAYREKYRVDTINSVIKELEEMRDSGGYITVDVDFSFLGGERVCVEYTREQAEGVSDK